MERRILHIDMDAFFASVEQVRNPDLVGKPLIVGGNREDRRGVVCTASYEARKYGVHSAMPLVEAKRLCPHGIFMRGHFEHYHAASKQVRAVLETVSPLVEFASIDEAYVDVSGSQKLFGGDDAIAAYIKDRVREETGLPCSVAIAPNKLVAKVATDEAKPDGYLRIGAGGEAAFFRPLPLKKLPGFGPRTRERFESLGVMTAGALADVPLPKLQGVFGPAAYAMKRRALGISTAEVVPDSVPKSISRETTFEQDLMDWDRIGQILVYLMERAMHALREEGMETKRVTLKVRHADFATYTYAKTLSEPTCLDGDVGDALHELVPKARQRRGRIRLIGVALTSLTCNQHQLRLFGGEQAEKWERAFTGVDHIRQRHGFGSIRCARTLPLGRDVELATPSLSR